MLVWVQNRNILWDIRTITRRFTVPIGISHQCDLISAAGILCTVALSNPTARVKGLLVLFAAVVLPHIVCPRDQTGYVAVPALQRRQFFYALIVDVESVSNALLVWLAHLVIAITF
jgi:hypothetical protein